MLLFGVEAESAESAAKTLVPGRLVQKKPDCAVYRIFLAFNNV